MITKGEIDQIVSGYELDKLTIGTLGSHSALNIFKGAKEEGFKTICICRERDVILYQKFPLADDIILVKDFSEILGSKLQKKLRRRNTILIPHGSFTAYINTRQITDDLYVPMFGNRKLLHWEASRDRQKEWLLKAGLRIPKTFSNIEDVTGLVIAKLPGAKGGKGYFLANSQESFHKKIHEMISRNLLNKKDTDQIHLQEYVLGLNVYPHYFFSILTDDVELLGVDRRYESAVDAIGRIPALEQLEIGISPTYTIVGNTPITLRESLLPELIRMGENVVEASKEIAPPGIVGPFCLETVIADNLEIYTFEISARIVAGTNVGIGVSPYAYLKHGNNMYVGRRIALEIKNAVKQEKSQTIFT